MAEIRRVLVTKHFPQQKREIKINTDNNRAQPYRLLCPKCDSRNTRRGNIISWCFDCGHRFPFEVVKDAAGKIALVAKRA